MMKNVAIPMDSITQVKIYIADKPTTLGKFYAEAAAEKIEREKTVYPVWVDISDIDAPISEGGEGK